MITPFNAIQAAAEAAPSGVEGVFEMQIKAVGSQGGMTYLNSEEDYRDQRCLTLAVPPFTARSLERKYGSNLESFFLGKTVRVAGEANRVKIAFFSNGQKTDKYYYQTHVLVTDEGQITIL